MILKVSTVALKEFLVPFTFKPKRILFLGSTEFEEPKDLRETKGTLVIFEKCWFLEFRIKSTICSIRNSRNLRNILSFMRNSRNQQFFRIYQGFYGSSKILWFLEFRTKKEKVQLLTITHFSFFLSCHFFFLLWRQPRQAVVEQHHRQEEEQERLSKMHLFK